MKKSALLFVALMLSALLCGCTISSGLFTGFSYNASDKGISASYASFNGSITQRVSLKEGETLSFRYAEDETLKAFVKQNDTFLCDIADSLHYNVPQDGTYDISVAGVSSGGAFSLSWEID